MVTVADLRTSEERAQEYREQEAKRCEIRATCAGCGCDVPAHYVRDNGIECEYCE